ncbi:MAG: putative toxin-antitoxin system toxin component, PIN family [Syntrophobacteraceae bacterium]|nr:putative toxin-antitoxin system toxin component, PIN family [Syntrophobacteraceae bacterium]
MIAPPFIEWLSAMLKAAEWIPVVEPVASCRDPKDDKFLELDLNGRADLIVRGDHDLPALDPFREMPVVSPLFK